MWQGLNCVAVNVAEMLAVGHEANLGDMRTRGGVEVKCDRNEHACGHTNFDTKPQGEQDGRCNCGKINFGIAPCTLEEAKVDKAQYGHDDGCSQCSFGEKVEQGRQQECGEQDADCGEGSCCRGLGTSVEVYD